MSRRWVAGLVLLLAAAMWPATIVGGAAGQPPLSALGLTLKDLPAHYVLEQSETTPAYRSTSDVLLGDRADRYSAIFSRPLQPGIVSVQLSMRLYQGRPQAVKAISSTSVTYFGQSEYAIMTPTHILVGDYVRASVTARPTSEPCDVSLDGGVLFLRGPYVVSLTAADCMAKNKPSLALERQEASRMMAHIIAWAKVIDGRVKKVKAPRVLDVYGPPPVVYPTATSVPALIYSIGSSSRGHVAQIDVTALHGAACVLMFVYKDGTIETLAPTSRRTSFMRGYDIQTMRWTPKTSEHGGAQGWVTCVLGSRSQTMRL